MESQLEDKESELGRPLSLGEQEDWLRQSAIPSWSRLAISHKYPSALRSSRCTGTSLMAFLWATVIDSIVSAVFIVFEDA